jgi:putative peptidoglycan lipid II flippase
MSDTRLYRAAGGMSLGTLFSRLTGLLRAAALTYALGVTASKLADTYNLANTTPNIVYELTLGGIFTSAFIPVLIDARERKRGDESALVSMSLLALAIVSALAAVGAPLIMRIYTFRITDPVLRQQQLELSTYLLRWFAPQIFFYGVSAIAQALLNVRGRFAAPAFAPVLNNLVVTGTFFAYARVFADSGLHISSGAKMLLGAGTTAGVVVQGLVLLPLLRGERLRLRVQVRDPSVTRVLRLAVYVVGYVVVNQIGLWVVLWLANGVQGGVTAWQVAFMFFQFPHGLFAVSMLTALFPDLSRAASSADWDTYRRHLSTGVRSIAYLLLPSAAGYAILARPITRLLIAHGVSGMHDANFVASVLQVFAASLIFFSLFQLLTRAFYALPDTRTPTAINAVAVAVNIAIDFPLFHWLGVRGLAFGHAVSYAVGLVLLGVMLNRRVTGGIGMRQLAAPVLRIVVAVAAMGLGVALVASHVTTNDALQVGAGVGAGAILYVAFSQVAGVEERFMLLGLLGFRARTDRGDRA